MFVHAGTDGLRALARPSPRFPTVPPRPLPLVVRRRATDAQRWMPGSRRCAYPLAASGPRSLHRSDQRALPARTTSHASVPERPACFALPARCVEERTDALDARAARVPVEHDPHRADIPQSPIDRPDETRVVREGPDRGERGDLGVDARRTGSRPADPDAGPVWRNDAASATLREIQGVMGLTRNRRNRRLMAPSCHTRRSFFMPVSERQRFA